MVGGRQEGTVQSKPCPVVQCPPPERLSILTAMRGKLLSHKDPALPCPSWHPHCDRRRKFMNFLSANNEQVLRKKMGSRTIA